MKSISFFLFFITSFFVRSLRWLSIVQQKEYRFDRVLLFIKSTEGVSELFRLLPNKSDFSRIGLKRPKLTARSIVIASIFFGVSFLYLRAAELIWKQLAIAVYPYSAVQLILFLLVVCTVYLILIPVLVMSSVVPTTVIAYLQTLRKLFLARQKLQKYQPKVIGITGSYGKTTTKILLAHLLQQKYTVFKTPKSFNTKYSVAQSVISGFTGQEIAIIEYGAYKMGEIRNLTKWIQPTFAIVTGLTEQHLGLFGSISKIILAKSELVASLPKKAQVVCNVYDEKTRQICDLGSQKNQAQIIEISEHSKVPNLENIKLNSQGKLQFMWNGVVITTQLIGMQYQELVKIVILVAQKFQVSDDQIRTALETFVPNEKFITTYTLKSGLQVIDDGGTSNPKGFQAVIQLSKKITANRKILITPGIVDLGIRSKEIHMNLATLAKKVFDVVVFVGEDGKQEFETVFTQNLVTTQAQLAEVLAAHGAGDLLVIEGKMPHWVCLEKVKQ